MEQARYEDESRLLSWLMVRQSAILLGENAEEYSELMTDEEESWVRAISRYGKDEQPFVFTNIYSEQSTGVYDNTPEDMPKGSDWISTETVRQNQRQVITLVDSSNCGKAEKDCYEMSCVHRLTVESSRLETDIRQEFKEDWNSMSDRPSEEFFLGLSGLRFIEDTWTGSHQTCPNCFVLTPVNIEECTVCDKELVTL